MDGIINVRKPKGWTSFDVVAKLRKIYGQKKIGHGGTLDPLAEGVLPVFLGRATRLIEYAPLHRKSYEAKFLMGVSTDTEDMTGTVLDRSPVEEDRAVWEKVAEKFRGDILQVPSAYSAVKVNGERAYKLAREGKEVALKARPVTIFDLQITEYAPPYISLSVTCSKGTYIRALGRDLGKEAGCFLSMEALVRTAAGPFLLQDSHCMEEIEENPAGCLISDLRPVLAELPQLEVSPARAGDFRTGKRFRVSGNDTESAAVFSGSDFLGIGEVRKGILHPKKVFL